MVSAPLTERSGSIFPFRPSTLATLRVSADVAIANDGDADIEVEKVVVAAGDTRTSGASGRNAYMGLDKGGP